jgi:iron complex transport system permease protein
VSVRVRVSGEAVVRLGGGRWSRRVQWRRVGVAAVLALVAAALAIVALGVGDFPIAPGDVVATLAGGGDPGTHFIVEQLRLPRVACALAAGAALGVSGAIFQSLTRNPLGSPDIVGFQTGSATGALFVITVLEGSAISASLGALIGGFATAATVYLLAIKHRRVTGFRLVLVGVGIGALMLSFNEFLLSRARIEDAVEATRWLLGSLSGRTWDDATPLLVAIAVLIPLSLLAGRSLRLLELGDDAAYGLGLRVERARVVLIALAVALVSATTVAVGPIVFVALTAPQIARRLSRSAEPALVCSALVGAIIVQAGDLAAQRIVPDTPLPVGIMCGGVGGAYLLWLLSTEWRSGRP